VNEEIAALSTMGLDPVRFLVTPRVIACVLMTPLLAVYADLIALIGGGVTMLTFSIPLRTYYSEAVNIVSLTDFVGGLVKACFFGLLISGVGCMRGLQTGTGAAAVGNSATKAVVSSLVLIVAVDGVFALIYWVLDI
jgi:phospholipid/cholesterol/gamma-HCH transport system permease protein